MLAVVDLSSIAGGGAVSTSVDVVERRLEFMVKEGQGGGVTLFGERRFMGELWSWLRKISLGRKWPEPHVKRWRQEFCELGRGGSLCYYSYSLLWRDWMAIDFHYFIM